MKHKFNSIKKNLYKISLIGFLFFLLLIIALILIRRCTNGVNITQNQLNSAALQTSNWIHTNGNYEQTRFYPGNQINTNNIKNLELAFSFKTKVKEMNETTPLISNGVMFFTTSHNYVYAINARNGLEIWKYKYKNKYGDYFSYACCSPANRGVAIKENLLFMGTLDGHLISLNSDTGKLVWDTQVVNEEENATKQLLEATYSEKMAPTVIGNKVLIGISGGENGIRGFLKAFDLKSGKLLWTFYTIPEKGHEGIWANRDATGHYLKRNISAEKEKIKKDRDFYKTLGGGFGRILQ